MAEVSGRFSSGLDMAALGARVRAERARRGLSLDALAARAGVSRSMLSSVERGDKVPTVLVLDRIATGLGTSIARLLADERRARVVVLRADAQDVARDPAGWERRILSPVLPGVEFEFMRTTLPPGVDAGVFAAHAPGAREYVAVERGALCLTLDGAAHDLRAGDSIYYDGDCAHGFANPGRTPCVYYLAMDVAGRPEGAAPEGTPPAGVPPGHAVAGHAVAGHAVAGHAVAGHAVAGHAVAGHAVAGHAVAGHAVAGHAVAGHAVAGHAVAGHAVAGHAVAGHAVAGHGHAQPHPARGPRPGVLT
ncbi:hypothetical protein tb265_41120 [Gemmatimonadetes bacterium T265]|nr:hypothetical protein tb265_41120 [Gemmatimonadetes bacterium T265]